MKIRLAIFELYSDKWTDDMAKQMDPVFAIFSLQTLRVSFLLAGVEPPVLATEPGEGEQQGTSVSMCGS
jgi:hypothetical protein